MEEFPIRDVSDTAFMVAAYRAAETRRPDALFRDTLAAKLSGERGKKIVAGMPHDFVGSWTVVIRTVIIDSFIQQELAGGIDTVVNLGCGLDTRPYRMDLPDSLRWVEVDYPPLIEWKNSQLADERPRCKLERVGMDLADVPARRKLLSEVASVSKKMMVITEGVIPYMTVDQVAALAGDLRALPAARSWVVDYFAPSTLEYRRKQAFTKQMQNAPFRFEPKDWFGFFDQHGWAPKAVKYMTEEGDRLRRPIPLHGSLRIFRMGLKARQFITRGKSQDLFRKFTGYILLEPA